MKSGTTTLHHLLAAHPSVYIPDPEIHFYCIDDIVQLPDAFTYRNRNWNYPDYDAYFDDYLEWYASFFKEAKPDQLIGEDSTVYLASPRSPERIAALLPDVKLLFILRDPVARMYSHYWHLVRTGRAYRRFEHILQYAPEVLLERSRYRAQLKRFYDVFPSDQIKVLLFEELIRQPKIVMKSVCKYLGTSPIPEEAFSEAHRNRARPPALMTIQLAQNFFFRSFASDPYRSHLPGNSVPNPGPLSRVFRFANRGLRYVNRSKKSYPAMRPETRNLLESILARENEGLSDLIGKDVSVFWPYLQ